MAAEEVLQSIRVQRTKYNPYLFSSKSFASCLCLRSISKLEGNSKLSEICYANSTIMPGDTCDRTCACLCTCKIPSTIEKLPVSTSLSTVQSNMPNRSFIVENATLVTATFCFHNSALSGFILNETFDKLQQQETL